VKIKLSAPARAFDEVSDSDISDIAKLQGIASTTDEECFSNYFQSFELRNTGLTGGYLRFELDSAKLRVVTEYEASHPLAEVEVSALIEYTLSQWMNGIGNRFSQEYATKTGIQIGFYVAAEAIMIEQEFE
jgi:hypothetical protein